MVTKWIRPVEGEYIPYQIQYINRVADGDVVKQIEKNITDTSAFLLAIPDSLHEYRYAEGKWTIKDIVQHLIDTERVMCYRALRFARKDQTPLPGFEQDDYVVAAHANDRTLSDLVVEFNAVRQSTIAMLNSFTDEMIQATGTANNGTVKVNSLAYVIAGHELHHVDVIKQKYLQKEAKV